MKKIIIICLTLLPLLSLARDIPATNQTVNDYTNTISESAKSEIDSLIRNYFQKTTNQLGVLVIDSLEGEDIEGFSNRVFTQWGLGSKDKDNGVLLVFAIKDRKFRIEVGQGLEGFLTDVESKRIQDQVKNHLKSGEYGKAIIQEIQLVIQTIEKNTLREKEYKEKNKPLSAEDSAQRSEKNKEFILFAASIVLGMIILFNMIGYFSKKSSIKIITSKIKSSKQELTIKKQELAKNKLEADSLNKQYKGSNHEVEDFLNQEIDSLREKEYQLKSSINTYNEIAKKYGVKI